MSQEELNNLSEYVVPDGMPKSVFENKYSRKKPDGTMQTYAERMREVVAGNFMMDPTASKKDYETTLDLAVRGIMPTAGRHIQHGDTDQPNKIMELHTNCSTAAFSFMLMRLLLRGSGVGRDYSSACCRVNWDNMPDVRLVLDETHPDFHKTGMYGWIETLRDAKHKYDSSSENTRWFTVDDSREGWAKVVEILETAAWQEKHKNKLFIFDFSQVRPEGAPIMGLQGRPASGPLSFMKAVSQIASIKGAGMKPWKQALFIDHYLAQNVAWGGARRAARMATKSWRDRDVIEFIDIKRGGFLWSANNSILVDAEFWAQAREPRPSYARRIFEAAVGAAYWDATGEPGFINVDRLNTNKEGLEKITGATLINEKVYTDLHHKTKEMIDNVVEHIKQVELPFITNPCFAADTRIVTSEGAVPIKDLVGKTVSVWDGDDWRTIDNFRVTGRDQEMLKITLHNGSTLRVTPYHTMYMADGSKCEAQDLVAGDKLLIGDVEYDGNIKEPAAYLKGFLLGDGTIGHGRPLLWLYSPKYMCERRLIASAEELPVEAVRTNANENLGFIDASSGRSIRKRMTGLSVRASTLLPWCREYRQGLPDYVFKWDRQSKMEFLAGLFDADATATDTKNGFSYQLSSVSLQLLSDVQTLLKSIGVDAGFSTPRKGEKRDMPGGIYTTQDVHRICISMSGAIKLSQKAAFERLTSFAKRQTTYNMKPKWNRVVSVEPDGVDAEVYCCTVPHTHKVTTAVGITTGQCGEIVLSSLGGYCVIGDINLAQVGNIVEASDAAAMMAKFLIRVNLMQSEYAAEVARTNRVGVSLTGIHEFAYRLFGLTFYDLIGYYDALENGTAESHKAHKFWMTIDGLRLIAEDTAADYSAQIDVVAPHTVTTIKPSGTVSKVMNCTEGAHLPALAHYIRWVQFKIGDADIDSLRAAGYPFKDISHRYSGHVAIGFPTKQPIVDLMGDKVITADETTPEENFKWLCLLERFWLGPDNRNNQVSYTLKYDSRRTSYTEFMDMILKWQPDIRCCSVMPSSDWQETEKVYGYVPEQPITADEYEELMLKINPVEKEAYDDESLMCESGACPIEFDINR